MTQDAITIHLQGADGLPQSDDLINKSHRLWAFLATLHGYSADYTIGIEEEEPGSGVGQEWMRDSQCRMVEPMRELLDVDRIADAIMWIVDRA